MIHASASTGSLPGLGRNALAASPNVSVGYDYESTAMPAYRPNASLDGSLYQPVRSQSSFGSSRAYPQRASSPYYNPPLRPTVERRGASPQQRRQMRHEQRASLVRRYYMEGDNLDLQSDSFSHGRSPSPERNGGGSLGGVPVSSRHFDVVMDGENDPDTEGSNEEFTDHLRCRYVDFLRLSPSPDMPPSAESAGLTRKLDNGEELVDVGAVAKFLDAAKPRTRLDAFPMFVMAKDVIRVLLSDKLSYSYSRKDALEAQLAAQREAAERKEAEQQAALDASAERERALREELARTRTELEAAEVPARAMAARPARVHALLPPPCLRVASNIHLSRLKKSLTYAGFG